MDENSKEFRRKLNCKTKRNVLNEIERRNTYSCVVVDTVFSKGDVNLVLYESVLEGALNEYRKTGLSENGQRTQS
jgi:hypothetical protein